MSFAEPQLVFVYGTLLRGYGNHARFLDGRSTFLGAYTTAEPYALFVADYPYVNKALPRTRIRGELYRVPVADMALLDALEEHPHDYCRERVVVTRDGDGDGPAETDAWVYFNPHISDQPDSRLPATFVPSGFFRDAAWQPPQGAA